MNDLRPLVVLAAGGTGGHMFPAQALAAELAGRDCRLAVITDRRGDAWQGDKAVVETHRIRAGGLAGKSFMARLQSGSELAIGTWQARKLLKRLDPKAVVGFGGYASVPTMLAARFGGFPAAIHEQNAVLGRANRLLVPRVECIATSFEKAEGLPDHGAARVVHTGMPIRPAVSAVMGRPYPTLMPDGPVSLLVIGGSQGARVFSDVVPEALALLDDEVDRELRRLLGRRQRECQCVAGCDGHIICGVGLEQEHQDDDHDVHHRVDAQPIILAPASGVFFKF